MQSCNCLAEIIPLGPNSHRGSSSLPEGFHFRSAYANLKWSAFRKPKRELSEPGRLSPPIWPCTTRGFPCLACRQASGGLLPHLFTLTCESAFRRRLAGFPAQCHRARFRRRYFLCGTFREPQLSPRLPWRYQARRPWVPDFAAGNLGVRTFLPVRLSSDPAITRLTRCFEYTLSSPGVG